MLKKDMNK